MSFALGLPRPHHLPGAPGVPPVSRDRLAWLRPAADAMRRWWITGSTREPVPGLLRAGRDDTPPAPMIMTAAFGVRPDHH